ncbi:hypothetical protein NPIL_425541 [Nephila pilipes]|uniref:Uncharacterized protein n=1 Tax=Nephila pilipes TaxID=299642 RepID=A0A8X6QC75_NEPPI|nr:hypothetical protein NPIL_425541 [Nephila pilipes]
MSEKRWGRMESQGSFLYYIIALFLNLLLPFCRIEQHFGLFFPPPKRNFSKYCIIITAGVLDRGSRMGNGNKCLLWQRVCGHSLLPYLQANNGDALQRLEMKVCIIERRHP